MPLFNLKSIFVPCGDQPRAIEKLSWGLEEGKRAQVLLGITGSGKTFTMAQVIARSGRPALILAHNKTLAAQLYQEFSAFFPGHAVEYFVSYYDYYQPEAYIARTDTYIEKDLAINDAIDRMRLSATRSLLEREDIIIVSSVSCIYGLGLPEYYSQMQLQLSVGTKRARDDILIHLVRMHYKRNDMDLARAAFRVRGDTLEIVPAYEENLAYRIAFFGDEVERLVEIDPITGVTRRVLEQITIYPGSHHVTPEDVRASALESIQEELSLRLNYFEHEGRLTEKFRLQQRTLYDIEMIKEMGYCKGIENYSRHFSKRAAGEAPPCLLDYFPDNFLLFVDESHQTLPQIRAMYNGDRARKEALIAFGFRLPSAFDNRPLKFEEFQKKVGQTIYVSATPGGWEIEEAGGVVIEQIIRPTGLLDPEITIKPATFQVDDCLEEIRVESEKGRRTLVTTLTKRLAEELTSYLTDIGVKAKYMHSDIDTLERVQIIKELRQGVFDVLVGINLLREGLDIPEVALVIILDADKEGFLRSKTALLQTCGRAARHVDGRVVMYANTMTESIKATCDETKKRRELQKAHNDKHGIIPKSAQRDVPSSLIETFSGEKEEESFPGQKPVVHHLTQEELLALIETTKQQMHQAARDRQFEEAARCRDLVHHYQEILLSL